MKRKYFLGILLILFLLPIISNVKGKQTEILYSINGQITYKKNMLPPVYILYNFSIPIELQPGDTFYWYQKYAGECDALTILCHLDYSGTFFRAFSYINPGEVIDTCDNTKKYTLPTNFGTLNTSRIHVIVKKSYMNVDYS